MQIKIQHKFENLTEILALDQIRGRKFHNVLELIEFSSENYT
jgi:hypothetical protein